MLKIFFFILVNCNNVINYKNKTNENYKKANLAKLIKAIKDNDLKLVERIVTKENNVNMKDDSSRTPLSFCAETGNIEIFNLLLAKSDNINVKDIKGRTPFLYSCKNNHIDIASKFIEKGVDINDKDKKYFTPLIYSCSKGNVSLARLLIEKGARLDNKTIFGEDALHTAVKSNHKEVVSLLLENKCLVNSKIRHKKSALMLSCSNESIDIAEILIEKGAKVHSKNKKQETALHIASKVGNLEIVKLLIKEKAHINEKDLKGRNPLIIAFNYGKIDVVKYLYDKINLDRDELSKMFKISIEKGYLDTVEFLLDKGFKAYNNFITTDKYGNETEEEPIIIAARAGKLEIVELLLKKGANINQLDWNKESPLIKAAKGNYTDLFRFLVDNGADLNAKGSINVYADQGKPMLIIACENENIDIVKILLSKEVDVNDRDKFGKTPLHIASYERNEEIVKLLLNYGAEVNIRDEKGKSALSESVFWGNVNITKLLIAKGADLEALNVDSYQNGHRFNCRIRISTAFRIACLGKDLNLVKTLLEEINSYYSKLEALSFASLNNYTEIIKYILNLGTDPNATLNENSVFPLILAAGEGNLENIKLLLSYGADINIKDVKSGQTALISSLISGNYEVAKFLIENGANINECDISGNTPLMYSFHNEYIISKSKNISRMEVIKLMLSKELDVNFKNNYGETAMTILCSKYHNLELAKILIENGADINIKNKDGKNCLILLIEKRCDDLEFLNLLVKNGLGVNSTDNEKRTPLMYAAENNNFNFAKALIEKGANVNKVSKYLNHNALDLAVSFNNLEIVKLLLENGANVDNRSYKNETTLMQARSPEIITLLLDKGANVNALDDENKSALIHLASSSPDKLNRCIEILIESGANISRDGKGALKSLISKSRDVNSIKKLIKNGVPIGINSEGYSSLLKIVDEELIEMLKERGANINSYDENRETVLLTLCSKNYIFKEDIVTLLKCGADPNKLDSMRRSSLVRYLESEIDRTDLDLLSILTSDVNKIDKFGNTAVINSVNRLNWKRDDKPFLKLIENENYNFTLSNKTLHLLKEKRNKFSKDCIITFLDKMKSYYSTLDGDNYDLILAHSRLVYNINFDYDIDLKNQYIGVLREITKFMTRTGYKIYINKNYLSYIRNLSLINDDTFTNIINYFDKSSNKKRKRIFYS